jgi:general secretion pathway protein G
MFRKTFKKGFSLVELLVVITIIAILSVAAYSAVGGNTIKARDAKRKQDLTAIQQAIELFYVEKGVYPAVSPTGTVKMGGVDGLSKKQLSELPKDPSGKKEYVYHTGGSGTYELATVLENDGDLANYTNYVVGNSDTPLTISNGTIGLYRNGTDLAPCSSGVNITSGQVIGLAVSGPCVPYDPR